MANTSKEDIDCPLCNNSLIQASKDKKAQVSTQIGELLQEHRASLRHRRQPSDIQLVRVVEEAPVEIEAIEIDLDSSRHESQ